MIITMRPRCVYFLAAKVIVSTALMTSDLLEAPLDGGSLPYNLATNREGTRCDVVGVKILCWCFKAFN